MCMSRIIWWFSWYVLALLYRLQLYTSFVEYFTLHAAVLNIQELQGNVDRVSLIQWLCLVYYRSLMVLTPVQHPLGNFVAGQSQIQYLLLPMSWPSDLLQTCLLLILDMTSPILPQHKVTFIFLIHCGHGECKIKTFRKFSTAAPEDIILVQVDYEA